MRFLVYSNFSSVVCRLEKKEKKSWKEKAALNSNEGKGVTIGFCSSFVSSFIPRGFVGINLFIEMVIVLACSLLMNFYFYSYHCYEKVTKR